MQNSKQKSLRKQDCLMDWEHYSSTDEDGHPITISISPERRNEWKLEDCGCSEYSLAGREECINYYFFEYNRKLIEQYYKERGTSYDAIALWGLSEMFNDGWLKSPVFVDWKDEMRYCLDEWNAEEFLNEINDPQIRVDILTHVINNADYIFAEDKKYFLPHLKYLQSIHKAVAQMRKKEQNKHANSEKLQSSSSSIIPKGTQLSINFIEYHDGAVHNDHSKRIYLN